MSPIQPLSSDELEPRVLSASGPVVLDFYQASCPPCRALEPRLEDAARRHGGRVPVYRVDIDQDPEIAERFGIDSLPTVLVVQSGKESERLDGLITKQQLEEVLERVRGS